MTNSIEGNIPPGQWYKRLLAFLWFDIILLVFESIIAIKCELFQKPPRIHIEEMEKRSGHVAVITGGPRGLAVGLLKRLLQLDYTVIMGARNVRESKKRLNEFSKANPDLLVDNVHIYEMDLMSLESVQKFAKNVLANVNRIDLILCNAANMNEPYVLTVDGYESQFQVNYLSNFLLIQLLLEKLKQTSRSKGSPCQIIYSSSIVYEVGKLHLDEFEKPKVYTSFKFYFTSKLCQVASMLAMERRFREEKVQILCYCIHPGLIPTDLWTTAGGRFVGYFGNRLKRYFRTVENGADTILWPVFSQEFQHSGGHFLISGTSRKITSEARNQVKQEELYKISMQLIKDFNK